MDNAIEKKERHERRTSGLRSILSDQNGINIHHLEQASYMVNTLVFCRLYNTYSSITHSPRQKLTHRNLKHT